VKILQDICEVDYKPEWEEKSADKAGGESIMVLNVDEPVSAAGLLRLQNIDGIYDA
jgi:hypothetical protein